MNRSILEQARKLLENSTPLQRDCGRQCGAACCDCDDEGKGGVFLFPGEEEIIGEDWASVTQVRYKDSTLKMLTCDGTCERQNRPLGCMIFPLTPCIDKEGNVTVRFDYRARPLCPLVKYGMNGLRKQFVDDVTQAMTRIAADEEGRAFLKLWQEIEEEYDFKL